MPQMSPAAEAHDHSQGMYTADLAPGILFPYYGRGEKLKAKHVGTHMISGRKLETWALGLLPVKASSTVLDAGCGWGRFTWPLIELFSLASNNVTCVDSSFGMIETSAEEAERRWHRPGFASADIQALPFATSCFDIAMANHVLYHLTDIHAGVLELARVLKENGSFLATTNSDEVSVPVLEFHYAALDKLGIHYESQDRSPFSMENGAEILASGFNEVKASYFEDETCYSGAEQFLASYKTIGRYRNLLARKDIDADRKQQLPDLVLQQAEEAVRKKGELRSPVRMGAFVCRGPKH